MDLLRRGAFTGRPAGARLSGSTLGVSVKAALIRKQHSPLGRTGIKRDPHGYRLYLPGPYLVWVRGRSAYLDPEPRPGLGPLPGDHTPGDRPAGDGAAG